MLPDLPRLKKRLQSHLERQFQELVDQRSPLMRQIGVHVQSEGDRYSLQVHGTGEIQEHQYKTVRGKITWQKTELPQAHGERVASALESAASEIASQQAGILFTAVSDATERAGTAIDARGKPFDPRM